MKLIIADGGVVAIHADDQSPPPGAYGVGASEMSYEGPPLHIGDPAPPVNLAAYAADARWRRETGGIVVAGIAVATDDRSKMMIIGARLAAMADDHWSTIWRGVDGAAHPVDAAAMIAISDAVQAHVNQCFAAYAQIAQRIASGQITSTAAIDAAIAGT